MCPPALIPVAIAVGAAVAGAAVTEAMMPDNPEGPKPIAPPPPPPEVLERDNELEAKDNTKDIIDEQTAQRRKVQRHQATAFDKKDATKSVNKTKSLLGE